MSDDFAGSLYLRLKQNQRGRLKISEFYLDSPDDQISAETLRRIRLGSIEAWANTPPMRDYITSHLNFPGPDLSRLAGYFGTTFAAPDMFPETERDWVKRSFWAQDEIYNEVQAARARPAAHKRQKRTTEPEARLEPPGIRPYPDDFYRQVAELYAQLGSRPAVAIARANDIPVKTVHRWIAEARKRRYLGSGQQGKAG